jgi:hypothetical protein
VFYPKDGDRDEVIQSLPSSMLMCSSIGLCPSHGNTIITIMNTTMGHVLASMDHTKSLAVWLRRVGDKGIHATDGLGDTIGHVCATFESLSALAVWLEAGGNREAVNAAGWTIGKVAMHAESQDVVHDWIEQGGDIIKDLHDHHGGDGMDDARGSIIRMLDAVSSGDHGYLRIARAASRLIRGHDDGFDDLHTLMMQPDMKAYAQRITASFADPIQMATWIHVTHGHDHRHLWNGV